MVPALSEWTKEIDALTDSLYPTLRDGPSDPASPLELLVGIHPKERLDAWLEVAFSLLRWSRESYQEERWNQILQNIGGLLGKAPAHSDRFHYEKVLQALWNLDYDKAAEQLQCWNPSPSNPLGQMWKASALAELDQLGEAVGLLESALESIRQSLVRAGQNIHLLSLEGWCMRSLMNIESSLRWTRRSKNHASFLERWQELRAWECDPWDATSYLSQALETEPPHRKPSEKSHSGFDPGTTSSTRTLSADPIADNLPAFAFIRVFELVGMPLRCRNIDCGSENLKRACQWIEPYIPFWSPALLLRCNSRKAISENDSISRAAVASMDHALVDRLYHWAVSIFDRALKKARKDVHDHLNNGLFESVPEILSRLAFRLDRGSLNHCFERAITFYEKAPIHVDSDLALVARLWFNRLFLAAEADLLMEWLPRLIKLDLPEMGEQLRGRLDWGDLEPLDIFPEHRLPDMSDEFKALLHSSIGKLLRLVAALDRGKIDAGVIRLSQLHRLKVLDEEQTREFGAILWRNRKENGLPDVSIYHFCAFVSLPSPPDVKPAALIKEEIFKLTVGHLVREIEGGKCLQYSESHRPNFISEAASASYSPAFCANAPGSMELEWSVSDCRELLARTREWWHVNKKGISRRREEFAVVRSIYSEARDWVRLLAFGILPHLDEAAESETREIVDWLVEARDKGGLPQLALPYVLIAKKAEFQLVSSMFHEDLQSSDEKTVNEAATGLWHWLGLSSRSMVADPPPHLISLLVWRVAYRVGSNLPFLMQILEKIVRDYPKALSQPDIQVLAGGLTAWRMALKEESGKKSDREQRLELCHRSTKLAGAMFIWRKQNEPDFDAAGEKELWQQFSGNSVVPEIRRGFENYFCDH